MTKAPNQSTAIAVDPRAAYAELQDYLLSKRQVIANIAPKYLDTERMIRLALGASSRQPQLLLCTPKSWVMALMDCAFYGLEPNHVLGHAYLVPYMNNKLKPPQLEVTFMPGYKGLSALACEHAGFDDIEARLVYANEIAEGRFKETPHDPRSPFHHEPYYQAEARGDLAGTYAVGWRGPDKRPRFKFLTLEEVEGYRARSRAANSGPWVTDYEAMVQKTAVRRMLSLAPLKPGSKLGNALEQESASERDEILRAQDWQVEDTVRGSLGAGKTTQLAAEIKAKAAATATAPPREPTAAPQLQVRDPLHDSGSPADGPQQDMFVP